MREALAALRRFARGRDVALAYGAVVLVVAVALNLLPQDVADTVVLKVSTNLVNLRQHPPFVVAVSAFVEPSLLGLVLVVPLVWAFGALQRRVGRAALVTSAVLGHLTATLVVSTVLLAGIAKGRIALAEATASDVGVSYALVTVLGLLTAWAPAARRRWFLVGGTGGLVGLLLVSRTFTDLGHLVGWAVGLSLALLVVRVTAAGSAR
jgi:hypothetical protein